MCKIQSEDEVEANYLNICLWFFQNPDTKITWYQSIDSDGSLLCKFCNLKYITEYSLRWHIQKKHLVEYTQLKKLVLLHKRKTNHVCRICKKIFICISELKSHVDTKHKIDIIKSSCTECDASFSNINELSVHMYVKHQKMINIFSFICDICGYRAKKRSHLKQHFLTHNDDKRLCCPNCDYKTNLKSNLRIHIRRHTKVMFFECQFEDCIYQSSSKASLRSHTLKHFPEKNMLFCDKCNYKTVYKHSLKKHSDSHERNCTRIK